MACIEGEARGQQTLFPLTLDDLIPADHVCRVIEAFVNPRDLLKLSLYGYLHQVRSSRRREAECRRNLEMMWLLGRLIPDYKSMPSSGAYPGMQGVKRVRNWFG